jgi:chemotaxis protein methyltransferase CheR
MQEEQTGALDVAQIRGLLEAIHARYGYDLRSYARGSLTRRLQAALARWALPDLATLQHRALTDAAWFAELLESLLVNVSDLFRDPDFYAAFRREVVPVLRTYPQIRVWHAGCARGEEAYASAIVLAEEGLLDRSQIYATDLGAQVIEEAKQGFYSAQRVDAFADGYFRAGGRGRLADFYTIAYDRIAMKESLRRRISFFQHDLVSDQVFGEMQMVFCRNVLIYFDRELQRRVYAKLEQSLCPAGFLALGNSEQMPRGETAFVPFCSAQRIYRRTR